tara:strand:- start:232 stop:924 length:693 start_codon:yes stop_codon:yes gene_type:complete
MTVANKITFSENTTNILKNFSGINSNILIRAGNTIRTLGPMKNILAEATIAENFDRQVGIWDLNQFLGTISLMESPDFDFEDGYVDISGKNGASVRYYYSAPELLTTTNKPITMPETVVQFDLNQSQLIEVQKASSVLGLSDLCVRSDGSSMEMVALNKKTPSSNSYSIDLGGVHDSDHAYEFYFKVDNLKVLSGNYDVQIAETNISQFTHKTLDLKYWIALEADSTYNP